MNCTLARHSQNDELVAVLRSLRREGIAVWMDGGRLHFRAPKNTNPRCIEQLRAYGTRIALFLQGATSSTASSPQLLARPQPDRAPLTFSQVAHWNLYQLGQRQTERTVTSATRIHGKLHLGTLRESLGVLCRRHEALRSRVIGADGALEQVIDPVGSCCLEVRSLSDIPGYMRDAEVELEIKELIQRPVNVSVGPMFVARLLNVRDDDHVLILAMEHLISDGYSLAILKRDLVATYAQLSGGKQIALPEVRLQLADYACWQQATSPIWAESHVSYWSARLNGCDRVRFPRDRHGGDLVTYSRGTVSIRLDHHMKADLGQFCKLRRTTLVLSIFTAYSALVLRWCNVRDAVFQYQVNARSTPGIENTIGYFAGVLFLRVQAMGDDTFLDLLSRVTSEYCAAHEHADDSYLVSQRPLPEYARNSRFNWLPQQDALRVSDEEAFPGCSLPLWSPMRFVFPPPKSFEIDREPYILWSELPSGVVGDLYFPLALFSPSRMKSFARNLEAFIGILASEPTRRLCDIPLLE